MAVSDMRYNEYYGVAVRQLQRTLYYNKDDKADVILLYDDLSDVEGVNLKVDFAQYCDMDEVPFSADDAIRSLCERISAITHHPLSDVYYTLLCNHLQAFDYVSFWRQEKRQRGEEIIK